jgi:hypothetical protein
MYLSTLYANLLFAVIGSNYVVALPPIRNVRTSTLYNLTGINKNSLLEAEKVRPIEINVIRPFTYTISQVKTSNEMDAVESESYNEALEAVNEMRALELELRKAQLRAKAAIQAHARKQQERKVFPARKAPTTTILPTLFSTSFKQHKSQVQPVAATKWPTQSAALEHGHRKTKVHPANSSALVQTAVFNASAPEATFILFAQTVNPKSPAQSTAPLHEQCKAFANVVEFKDSCVEVLAAAMVKNYKAQVQSVAAFQQKYSDVAVLLINVLLQALDSLLEMCVRPLMLLGVGFILKTLVLQGINVAAEVNLELQLQADDAWRKEQGGCRHAATRTLSPRTN